MAEKSKGPSLILGDVVVSSSSMPYIIAEIGVNHEGSLKNAKKLVQLAKEGGANAVKFQSYKAESLASKNSPAYWDLKEEPTPSQYDLFKKYDSFGSKEFKKLAEYCKKTGIVFSSTPFDDEAIEFLDPLVPFYKVASADITNIPFLRKIAARGKPVILSTGASTLDEIDIAIQTLHQGGCSQIALLHCVLNYPTKPENANLNMIDGLRTRYPDMIIGYSDHTLPDPSMTVLTTAYLKGARILEKHFTYDKRLRGNDHYHSMDIVDLKVLIKQLNLIRLTEGSSLKKPLSSEKISRQNARRSIVLTKNVEAGTKLTEELLTYKRPGTGISPIYWDQVIGLRVARSLESDHILQWKDLEANQHDNYNSKEFLVMGGRDI